MKMKWKILTGMIVGLLLGGATTYFFMNYDIVKRDQNRISDTSKLNSPSKKTIDSFFNDSFGRDFFDLNSAPFSQMEKMRRNMDKLFEDQLGSLGGSDSFDNWFENRFGGSVFDIKQPEDDDYIYYEIKLEGLDKNNLQVNVKNGNLEVSGEVKKVEENKSEGSLSKSYIHQSFHRIFPVPRGVQEDKIEFEVDGDKLIVKFPKRKINL